MKRRDCAYCIDLDEQGALCDHPLHWDCGEPVEVGCSSRCADYERRIPIAEALSRIHDLEAKLAESKKWRASYADMVIPLKFENFKLRKLARDMMLLYDDGDYCTVCEKVAECGAQSERDDDCLMRGVFRARMRELGIEEE